MRSVHDCCAELNVRGALWRRGVGMHWPLESPRCPEMGKLKTAPTQGPGFHVFTGLLGSEQTGEGRQRGALLPLYLHTPGCSSLNTLAQWR